MDDVILSSSPQHSVWSGGAIDPMLINGNLMWFLVWNDDLVCFILFQFSMKPDFLHIWPRNTFMMIALPNLVRT